MKSTHPHHPLVPSPSECEHIARVRGFACLEAQARDFDGFVGADDVGCFARAFAVEVDEKIFFGWQRQVAGCFARVNQMCAVVDDFDDAF